MTTVDQIQSAVAAVVDQDSDTSNIATDDYALRLEYLNQRERQWSEFGDFDVMYREFHALTSTASGNATVSLPADFRKLASYPQITHDGSNTDGFAEIRSQEESNYKKSVDKYVKIMGNNLTGRSMVINPGNSTGNLASGASIMVPYYATPTSLASPANIVQCPNTQYLITGVIADVWESREDARFQIKKAEATEILLNMVEREVTPTEASAASHVRSYDHTRHNFKWGRD